MNTQRLLAIAGALCGDRARRTVFDPLVADWEREWRDAGGSHQRLTILLKGACAYAWSLLRCFSLSHIVASTPSVGFSLTIVVFAAAAVLVHARFISYGWNSAHWDFNSLKLVWFPWGDMEFVWLVPRWFASGLVIAVLPAALLAAAAGWRARRIVLACTLAATMAIAINLWIAPASEQVRRDRRYAAAGHRAPVWPRDVGAELASQAAVALTFAGLGLLGGTLGRVRAASRIPTRLRSVALWWAFAWLSYSVLGYWSGELRRATGVRIALSLWLPPLVLLIVASGAWWLSGRADSARGESPALPPRA